MSSTTSPALWVDRGRPVVRVAGISLLFGWATRPTAAAKGKRRTGPLTRGVASAMLLGLMGRAALAWSATPSTNTTEAVMPFSLTSPAFTEGQSIPAAYTCEGRDHSPALAWTDPPAGTKSFALISDDPDAPGKTWVHWVVYNLPPASRALPEAFPRDPQRPDGTRQGRTDFGAVGYGGPCPPSGVHRYFFKLYALDAVVELPPGATKAQLERAMAGHILGQAQLIGTYQRRGR